MNLIKMSSEECRETEGGEITLAAIMALMAVAIVSVVCFRLFFGKKSKVTLPGGFTFQWE